MKRILLLTFLLIFALNSLAFAAKSSSKPASPSRPATSAPAAPSAAPAQTAPSGYKPSAPANTYSDKAPAAKPPAPPQAAPQSTGSSWLRNAGMLAGGMMLGGMLSNMFGHGNSGMLADILGILISVIPIIAIFMLGRFLWLRHKEKQQAQMSNRY